MNNISDSNEDSQYLITKEDVKQIFKEHRNFMFKCNLCWFIGTVGTVVLTIKYLKNS